MAFSFVNRGTKNSGEQRTWQVDMAYKILLAEVQIYFEKVLKFSENNKVW